MQFKSMYNFIMLAYKYLNVIILDIFLLYT